MRKLFYLLLLISTACSDDSPNPSACNPTFLKSTFTDTDEPDANSVSTYTIAYDNNKLPTKMDYTSQYTPSRGGTITGTYIPSFDDNKNLIKVEWNDNYHNKYKIEYAYSGGLLTENIKYKLVSETYQIQSRYVYSYNAKGQLIKSEWYDKNSLSDRYTYEYTDDSKNPTSQGYYPNGSIAPIITKILYEDSAFTLGLFLKILGTDDFMFQATKNIKSSKNSYTVEDGLTTKWTITNFNETSVLEINYDCK